MSATRIDNGYFTGSLSFDKCLLLLQNGIRADTMTLLMPDDLITHRTPADLAAGLETMRTLAEATIHMSAREKAWAEKEKIKAETEKIQAETEKIRVEMEKIKAETEKMRVEME